LVHTSKVHVVAEPASKATTRPDWLSIATPAGSSNSGRSWRAEPGESGFAPGGHVATTAGAGLRVTSREPDGVGDDGLLAVLLAPPQAARTNAATKTSSANAQKTIVFDLRFP
jgi:hypothetical protein